MDALTTLEDLVLVKPGTTCPDEFRDQAAHLPAGRQVDLKMMLNKMLNKAYPAGLKMIEEEIPFKSQCTFKQCWLKFFRLNHSLLILNR